MIGPKLKLFSLSVVLALPLVWCAFYYGRLVSAGKQTALPDWVALTPLAYIALSAAWVFYVGRQLGIYHEPKSSPAKVVPELLRYFRRQALILTVVWCVGLAFSVYEGFSGRVPADRAVLSAFLFLMAILGMIWLIRREDAREASRENCSLPNGVMAPETEQGGDEAGLIYTGFSLPLIVRLKRDRYLAYLLLVLTSILVYVCMR